LIGAVRSVKSCENPGPNRPAISAKPTQTTIHANCIKRQIIKYFINFKGISCMGIYAVSAGFLKLEVIETKIHFLEKITH
jgi:hypothetical protein